LEGEQSGQQAPEAVPEVSLRRRFLNVRTLLSFALGIAIIVFFLTRFDVDFGGIWEDVKRSNPWLYLAGFLIYYASFVMRGWRWSFLLRNVGFGAKPGPRLPAPLGLSYIIYLSWFANCVVPARLGEAYRAYMLREDSGASFSRSIGTVLAERVVDMVVLFLLLAVAAIGLVHSAHKGTAVAVLLAGLVMVVLIVLVVVAMVRFRGHIERRLPHRFQASYAHFHTSTFDSFRRRMPQILFVSMVIWFMEVARLYFVSQGLGYELGLALVLFVALANSLLSTLPLTPGGLGLVEAGMTGLLMMELTRQEAVSVALLDRSISYVSIVIFGAALFFLRQYRQVRRGVSVQAGAVPDSLG